MKKHLAPVLLIILLTGCESDPYCGVKPDLGKRLHEFGRSATWYATHKNLENNRFEIAAGPTRYQDESNLEYDYYSIHVARKHGWIWHIINKGVLESSSYVLYQRDFEIEDIPKNIIHKRVEEIAEYNKSNKVVTFKLGNMHYKYKLPLK